MALTNTVLYFLYLYYFLWKEYRSICNVSFPCGDTKQEDSVRPQQKSCFLLQKLVNYYCCSALRRKYLKNSNAVLCCCGTLCHYEVEIIVSQQLDISVLLYIIISFVNSNCIICIIHKRGRIGRRYGLIHDDKLPL